MRACLGELGGARSMLAIRARLQPEVRALRPLLAPSSIATRHAPKLPSGRKEAHQARHGARMKRRTASAASQQDAESCTCFSFGCAQQGDRTERRSITCSASGEDLSYPAPKQAKKKESQSQPDTIELDQEETAGFLELELQSATDAPPRHYEFVFLIHENSVEDIPAILDKIKDQIAELRGKIWRLNDWGLRPLAYQIKKAKKANYFLLNVELSSDKANALNTFFQRDERIIRHLMTKMDKPETQDYPAPLLYNAYTDDDDEEEEGDDEDDEDWDEDDDEEEDQEGDEGDDEDDGDEKEYVISGEVENAPRKPQAARQD